MQNQNHEVKNILIKLEESIKNNEMKNFESLIDKYEQFIKLRSHKELICRSVKASFEQENIYYREKLFELDNKYYLFEMYSSELLRIAIQANNVEMAHRFVKSGLDLTNLDKLNYSPLEDAIRNHNLEIISMILYYGGYTNNMQNILTSFMLSIICQCSEDIQRILMEYETSYNRSWNDDSILFMAIMYRSPLIFDLIERGADPSYIKITPRGNVNALFVAIEFNCDMELIRELWRLFDYDVWKEFDFQTEPTSLVCCCFMFFPHEENINVDKFLEVFLGNEEKLKLDIEYYESVQRESFILNFFSICIVKGIDQSLTQKCILHLLSCGGIIYFSDLDILYSPFSNQDDAFFDILLFMDLQKNIFLLNKVTFMYFRYTIDPDLQFFLSEILQSYIFRSNYQMTAITDLMDGINKASRLFAFKQVTKNGFKALFRNYPELGYSLEDVKCFPSLLQLARDASRSALCKMHNIQRISQFYDMIKMLNLPNYVKNLLTYKKNIY